MKRVYIVDDEPAVRTMTSAMVRQLGFFNHPFASAGDFLEAFADLPPGVILVDLRMAAMSGLELLERTAGARASFPAVLVTGFAEVDSAVAAMKAGALDVLRKPVLLAQLSDVLTRAFARLAPAAPPDLLDSVPQLAQRNALTDRQAEVLQAMVAGKPNKDIAIAMGIATRTVEMHRAAAMAKLGVNSLPALLRVVLQARAAPVARVTDPPDALPRRRA